MASAKGHRNAAIWGTNVLTNTKDEARGILDAGAHGALDALGGNYGKAADAVNAGYGSAIDTLKGNNALFAPLSGSANKGFNLYADALGVNGADAAAGARSAFQTSPGYQWQQDQALDAVMRKAAATGGLGGGNTLTALSDRAQNMANTEWSNWLQNLGGFAAYAPQIAGAQAANNTNLANVQAGQGTTLGNLYSQLGSNQANLMYGTAKDKANVGLDVDKSIVGLGTDALKAGDQAKMANQNLALGAVGAGLNLLGSFVSPGGILNGATKFA